MDVPPEEDVIVTYESEGEGEGDTLPSAMYQTLFDELSAQRKVTEKAQEQIDTLLDIIKGFAGK